ncbi:MAG: hypothetical protein ACUVQ8_05235 [Nitrososphaeria archaeon]|jgi:hypothetical protein
MTREEKIRIALVLIAISAQIALSANFAGVVTPLGQRIGGPEVI